MPMENGEKMMLLNEIDVVIPTKGEWTLPYCVRSMRKSIPNNRLILVTTKKFEKKAEKLADLVVVFNEKNVGKARNEGLKLVETPFYASIDSDVQVTPEWFNWCNKTIQKSDVAACQGYAKTMGKNHGVIQEKWIREKGEPGKRFCCLGNTILKTQIIRQVGMPLVRVEEDWQLRWRVEASGYKWVSNINVICPHLKTDVDAWKHAVWWGQMGGSVKVTRCLARIPYYLTFGMFQRSIKQNLFLISFQAHLLYGRFKGCI